MKFQLYFRMNKKTKWFTFIQQMQYPLTDTQLPPLMHGLHHSELLTVTCTVYV